jgi:hypothetical protein
LKKSEPKSDKILSLISSNFVFSYDEIYSKYYNMNSKITSEGLLQLTKEVKEATKLLQILFPCPEFRKDWLPRHEVMQYLGFAATQMNAIARKYNLQKSIIGKRVFYNTKQLIEILNQESKIN